MRWLALAGATLLLHGLGRGALGPPPLSSAHELALWWQRRGPLLGTFAAAREMLWWIGCYLLALGVVAALAVWRQSARLIRGLSRWRLPGAITVLRASIGASALGASLLTQAGSSFAAGAGGPGGQGDAAPPVLRYAGPEGGPGGTAGRARPATPGAAAVMPGGPTTATTGAATVLPRAATRATAPGLPTAAGRGGTGQTSGRGGAAPAVAASRAPAQQSNHHVPPPSPANAVPPVTATRVKLPRRTRAAPRPYLSATGAAAHEQPGRSAPPNANGRWTVRPGDSLWSIAATTLAAAWGRPPDTPELGHYWWQVVEANRRSLPIPSDPDLLFPGDEVVVPPPPAPPGSS